MAAKSFLGAVLLLGLGLSWYRWEFPYGRRTCALPCMMAALNLYALDNGGWYPHNEKGPLYGLMKLSPKYVNSALLAGLSGMCLRHKAR